MDQRAFAQGASYLTLEYAEAKRIYNDLKIICYLWLHKQV